MGERVVRAVTKLRVVDVAVTAATVVGLGYLAGLTYLGVVFCRLLYVYTNAGL
jgi:hypothetical protein